MLSTPPSPGSPCTRPGRHVGTNPVCISVGFTCLQCIYTWRPKGRFSSLPLPDFPGSSALLGFHHGAKSGAAALAEYSCAGGVRLRWRCTAALEVYGCAEVYGCVSILAVQRRRRGRGELFHKSLVIKLVNKIQKSFPVYHSSLVHGLLKIKDKII